MNKHFKTSPYIDFYFSRYGKMKLDLASSGRKERTFGEFSHLLDFSQLFDNRWRGSEDHFTEIFLSRYKLDEKRDMMCVPGTSGANYVVQNALVANGETIAVESPVYDPLVISAMNSGKQVVFYKRPVENNFMPDLDSIEDCLAKGARMLVITNLHNPSGALILPDVLARIALLLDKHDAIALVDEVYIEFLPNWQEYTALRVSPRFLVSASLTKVYGLSELTIGWLAGMPEYIELCRKFFLTITGHNSSPSMEMAVQLSPHLDSFIKQDRPLIQRNRVFFENWARENGLKVKVNDYAPICLLGLPNGTDDQAFCDFAYDREQFFLAPGTFFGIPDHLRIGLFKDPEQFATGLNLITSLLGKY